MIDIDAITKQIMDLKSPTKREIDIIVKLTYIQGREDEKEKVDKINDSGII